MKTFTISLVSSVCVVAALSWSEASRAQAVPLVFQTTFNCPDWNQNMGVSDGAVCKSGDGISGAGAWAAKGYVDEVTAAANNPAGGGGKGFRHYRGDGSNTSGGGLTITLPMAVTEVWVRFYMKYSSGFAWTNSAPAYTKEHYWEAGTSKSYVVFGIQGKSSWGVNFAGGTNYPSSRTFAASQGGSKTGDGLWHAYEYHLKQNGPAATIEVWVDGVKYLTHSSANLGSTPWRRFILGSNQATVTDCNPVCYTDYDDIAVSTSGYIGLLGTPPAPVPPPQGLRVQ